jgi:hypothetical protein
MAPSSIPATTNAPANTSVAAPTAVSAPTPKLLEPDPNCGHQPSERWPNEFTLVCRYTGTFRLYNDDKWRHWDPVNLEIREADSCKQSILEHESKSNRFAQMMAAIFATSAAAAPVTPTAPVIPSVTPTHAVTSTPVQFKKVLSIPIPSVTLDQQREQILQLAFSCLNGLMSLENLTPEQALQIKQLANSLCRPCRSCKHAAITCSMLHAAWILKKRYHVDSDSF